MTRPDPHLPPASTPPVAAYTWDMISDRLEWDGDVAHVLGIDPAKLATGAAFDAHILPEQRTLRRAAMAAGTPDAQAGTRYQVRIGVLPLPGDAPIWLEDTGRFWPAVDGRPARAQGLLRRIDEQYIADQRLLVSGPDGNELNRTRLLDAVGTRLQRAERTGKPCALIFASLNGLEAVNAQLGFDIGDELIAEVGHLLKASAAASNAIYRYASNVLAILVDLPDAEALEATASSLVDSIRAATVHTSAGPLRTSISVGAIALPANAATASEAIAQALSALDLAKREPQGGLVVQTTPLAIDRTHRREQAASASVVAALESGRLLLALQPIVDARSAKPVYYEGLLRLRREDGTLMSASDFVADAEKLGLARFLDMRSLDLGLALLARHAHLTLFLNVSSLTAGDAEWLAILKHAIAAEPGLAGRLVIEITETAMIHDMDRVAAFVAEIRQAGCRIAIDDFGAGFTSLRILKSLKVDILKIDGMFVADLPHDEQARIIVKTMIDMAKALKLETIAEWVGDEASRDILREAGADYLQGFFFGRPILSEEAEKLGLL